MKRTQLSPSTKLMRGMLFLTRSLTTLVVWFGLLWLAASSALVEPYMSATSFGSGVGASFINRCLLSLFGGVLVITLISILGRQNAFGAYPSGNVPSSGRSGACSKGRLSTTSRGNM